MARYGLIVGINDYADAENIQSLRFAVEDARQVDRFFHACGFDVQALMDSEATCAAIGQQLREFSGRLQPNDVFLFYFSGHGLQWGAVGEERHYLLPRDADLWALKHGGAGQAIPMRLVLECTGGRKAKRVVILDACRSGLSPGGKGQAVAEERVGAKDISTAVAAARGSSPLIVVNSCRPGQLSYEHGGVHGGLFTSAMLSVFGRLRADGRPVAFTTETNGAIAQRMQTLAAECKLDSAKVGDFWFEGDATGVELMSAGRPRAGQVVAAAPAAVADPEKAEIKEWAVEDLKVEVERVEAAPPAAPSGGLPPVPEEILRLRGEVAGLERAIAQLKDVTHPSLKQAKAAVREAELQVQTFREDLQAHAPKISRDVWARLEKAVAESPQALPSSFCALAPGVSPGDLLSFVARLRNVRRAELALEAVRKELREATGRKVSELEVMAKSKGSELLTLEKTDLGQVLRSLYPSLKDVDLVDAWPGVEPQLVARGYGLDPLILLKVVENFLTRPAEICRIADGLLKKDMFREALARVGEAMAAYPGHKGLSQLLRKAEEARARQVEGYAQKRQREEEEQERALQRKPIKFVKRALIAAGAIGLLLTILGFYLANEAARRQNEKDALSAVAARDYLAENHSDLRLVVGVASRGGIQLRAWTMPSAVRPGETVTGTIVWETTGENPSAVVYATVIGDWNPDAPIAYLVSRGFQGSPGTRVEKSFTFRAPGKVSAYRVRWILTQAFAPLTSFYGKPQGNVYDPDAGIWSERTLMVGEGVKLRVPPGFKAKDGTAAEPYTNTGWAKEIVHEATGIEMVFIPAGSFMMGSPASEAQRDDDETQHRVTLTRSFYMGKYEVTQGEWQKMMRNNPSNFKGSDRLPVELVSWDDCQEFFRRAGGVFRLPTEAEWEYACRAGTTTPFHMGATISTDEVNYDGNYTYGNGRKGEYRQRTVEVGSFRPNAWGLFDMHGNVWEWCADWYGKYEFAAGKTTVDPTGPGSGESRVLRGGSWAFYPRVCRSAGHGRGSPGDRGNVVGFRVAVDLK